MMLPISVNNSNYLNSEKRNNQKLKILKKSESANTLHETNL